MKVTFDFIGVKTISVDVPDAVYQDIAQRAQQTGQNAEDLLRAAMEIVRSHPPQPRRTSVLALKPLDLGKPLIPLNNHDDLLGEMLNGNGH
jgi:hypothetical protein